MFVGLAVGRLRLAQPFGFEDPLFTAPLGQTTQTVAGGCAPDLHIVVGNLEVDDITGQPNHAHKQTGDR